MFLVYAHDYKNISNTFFSLFIPSLHSNVFFNHFFVFSIVDIKKKLGREKLFLYEMLLIIKNYDYLVLNVIC